MAEGVPAMTGGACATAAGDQGVAAWRWQWLKGPKESLRSLQQRLRGVGKWLREPAQRLNGSGNDCAGS